MEVQNPWFLEPAGPHAGPGQSLSLTSLFSACCCSLGDGVQAELALRSSKTMGRVPTEGIKEGDRMLPQHLRVGWEKERGDLTFERGKLKKR